ncbi:MAG: GAF domain-containing protein [Synechococcales cyanobacterium CRU_2_2]|nr:GAF domain-containing protein [Synechococcales cyanobacterium CRU_2_2]
MAIEQLSQTLQLDQALLYPYEAGDAVLSALVQFGTPGLTPIFPQELHLRQLPLLQQSLAQVKVAIFEQASGNHGDDPALWSILAAPIGYLGTAYGLLLLARRGCDSANAQGSDGPAWSDREQAFVEDVAAQLGGAIAYIFSKSKTKA